MVISGTRFFILCIVLQKNVKAGWRQTLIDVDTLIFVCNLQRRAVDQNKNIFSFPSLIYTTIILKRYSELSSSTLDFLFKQTFCFANIVTVTKLNFLRL